MTSPPERGNPNGCGSACWPSPDGSSQQADATSCGYPNDGPGPTSSSAATPNSPLSPERTPSTPATKETDNRGTSAEETPRPQQPEPDHTRRPDTCTDSRKIEARRALNNGWVGARGAPTRPSLRHEPYLSGRQRGRSSRRSDNVVVPLAGVRCCRLVSAARRGRARGPAVRPVPMPRSSGSGRCLRVCGD